MAPAAVWERPRQWRLGDRCSWLQVPLVCTTAHYAGADADHPWDPGYGWPPERAAALWAPDGVEAETQLVRLVSDMLPMRFQTVRFADLMRHVTRSFPREAA